MTYLTALLPVAQGVAVYAALTRAADSARAAGDPRGRGQVMADELVARIANGPGAATAADAPPHRPPARLEVQLVMTDRTLLAGHDEPAHLPGYGTVPGPWARDLVRDALRAAPGATGIDGDGDSGDDSAGDSGDDFLGAAERVQVWVRRLYTAPTTGQLIAMDSRARLAPAGLSDLIRARDGTCRTPWCDAPVRQIDHVVAHADGGPTAAGNLQGLCEACNYAKQAPGWQQTPTPSRTGGDGALAGLAPDVVTTTPTGHQYVSCAPALPGYSPAPPGSAPALPSATPAPLDARGRAPDTDTTVPLSGPAAA